MKIPANGFTHAGKFHADDVFATALLQIIRPDIRITRGFVVPDDFDGIVYDIGFGMFDHHQEPREYRANGIPYAAFGLLWRVLGPGLVGERQARLIDENFIQPLDLNDNTGEQNSLCDAIGFFNPVWDSKEDQDTCFFKAVAVAKQILEHQIDSANAVNRADEKVQQAYQNSRDGIVSFSLYGDWASPIEHCCHNGIYSPISNITPGDFVSSGYYYYDLGLMERFATLLGRREEAAAFAARRKSVAAAINRVFRDEETGDYAGGSQGSNVFALYLGLVPAQDTARVDEDVRRRGYHLTTGNLMTKYLLEVLTAYGYLETAYRLVVQTTYPSWGYMLSKDATTIWERWEYETGYGMNSHNHPMYGSISAWFYKYLAGISAEAPGFAAVKIQPYLPEELPFVRCSLETCAGRIGSSWSRETDGVELLVEIPGDVTADLYLPIRPDAAGVDRDGVPLWRRDTGAVPDDALRFIGGEPGYLHFAGRGGNYRFWIY